MARSKGGKDEDAPKPLLDDLLGQLERISRQFPGSRLLVDLARDAGIELARQLGKRVRRYRARAERAERKRLSAQARLVGLLHELATSTASLPLAPGQPAADPTPLLAQFRHLREEVYPATVRQLRDALDHGSRKAILRFLCEEVLYRSAAIISEHRLRHAHRPWSAAEENAFLDELRSHVLGKVNRGLSRATGLRVTPALGRELDALVGSSVEALAGLLTAAPQSRLIAPAPGAPLDARLHRPHVVGVAGASPVVRAVLFPGLLSLGPPHAVLEQALVQVGADGGDTED